MVMGSPKGLPWPAGGNMKEQIAETRKALKEAEASEDAALASVLREKLSDLADQAKPAAQADKAERASE